MTFSDQVFLGELYWRQLDALSPEDLEGQRVTLIGAGGIGSPAAIALAKMGLPRLMLYDDDAVSVHNLPNQFYRKTDVGLSKVDALKELLESFSDTIVGAARERYQEGSIPLRGIVVSGVDSMASRMQIWQAVKGSPDVEFYIDARMAIEVLTLYSLNPADAELAEKYEKTLFSDEEGYQARCTEQAIMYTPMVMAGLIASQVKKHIRKEEIRWEVIFDLKNLILMVN